MDKIFTWSEFFSMSENDLFDASCRLGSGESTQSSGEIKGPAQESMISIFAFASTYDVLLTQCLGGIEIYLN